MAKGKTPRWAWALTGSGHFFKECLRTLGELDDVDLFVSKAASEVVLTYRQEFKLPTATRDMTVAAAPVGLILTPATSNTAAKCVVGISDTLVTNVFAQAGKCRLPAIVFACKYHARTRDRSAQGHSQGLHPLGRSEKHRTSFESSAVVESLKELKTALERRRHELHG
jgi:flavoprotein